MFARYSTIKTSLSSGRTKDSVTILLNVIQKNIQEYVKILILLLKEYLERRNQILKKYCIFKRGVIMDYHLLWKAILIVIGGTFLLRVAGRKSISQMTLAQVVIMVGIGSLLVQPIVGSGVWSTLAVGLSLVLTLVIIEYGQLKFDFIEKFITGKSKVLIENGMLKEKNLSKLRLTVDQLEMQLRQNSITQISDVQYATLEPNGTLGFVLKENKQPATKGDIEKVLNELQQLRMMIQQERQYPGLQSQSNQASNSQTSKDNIFNEVDNKSHESELPKHLQ
jgi:uncharacterized membrane protein YcaP (DUF421 family)